MHLGYTNSEPRFPDAHGCSGMDAFAIVFNGSWLYGSSDLFPDDVFHAFRPFQSVNYISSHDGYTMYDLVAYNEKHNEANGHDNQDGPSEYSSNGGWEGDEQAPQEVLDFRKRQIKNFCCLLMLSAGTPMIRMGDEFMQTQHGNSNPYNQDNETTWLDCVS